MDNVQMLLDDHIVKAQIICGSPYIKPFEESVFAWENKLNSMYNIIDVWLKVRYNE